MKLAGKCQTMKLIIVKNLITIIKTENLVVSFFSWVCIYIIYIYILSVPPGFDRCNNFCSI